MRLDFIALAAIALAAASVAAPRARAQGWYSPYDDRYERGEPDRWRDWRRDGWREERPEPRPWREYGWGAVPYQAAPAYPPPRYYVPYAPPQLWYEPPGVAYRVPAYPPARTVIHSRVAHRPAVHHAIQPAAVQAPCSCPAPVPGRAAPQPEHPAPANDVYPPERDNP